MLRAQRLRLLKRERDRTSMRWEQFKAFVAGKAPMPERGFAYALYYQVAEDNNFGKQAVEWASGHEWRHGRPKAHSTIAIPKWHWAREPAPRSL